MTIRYICYALCLLCTGLKYLHGTDCAICFITNERHCYIYPQLVPKPSRKKERPGDLANVHLCKMPTCDRDSAQCKVFFKGFKCSLHCRPDRRVLCKLGEVLSVGES